MITTGQKITIQRSAKPRLSKTDLTEVKFGRVFSDHMYIVDYANGQWQQPNIKPFGDLEMSPATLVLHYGQSIFEGMKAYRHRSGKIALFRPQMNIARMNRSAQRMCMPQIPEGLFMDALMELIKLDNGWLPNDKEAALYIRPFMFASDEYIGVKASDGYRFMIFTCPVRGYYKEPVSVKVEQHYSRAFPGGTGATKCAGNYAAGLYPAQLAQKEGYHQLIWTDGKEHKYIEESGTMNVFFVVDGKILTPPTSGTILEGVTRDSIIELARHQGLPIEVRPVTVDEVLQAARKGTLTDAFGAGTAATIAHISRFAVGGESFELPPVVDRTISNGLAVTLDAIRRGESDDPFGWNVIVPD